MQFFHGLHFKIAAAVIGTIIALSTVYFVWDYSFYRKQLLEDLHKSSSSLSNMVLNGLLEVAMMGKHPELMQKAVESLGTDPSISAISIVGSSGVVSFSTQRQHLGRRFTLEDDGCRHCHHLPGGRPKALYCENDGEKVLRSVALIPNRAECQTCHSGQRGFNGSLVVDFATADVERKLRTSRYEMLAKAGMTVFAILGVLGVILHRLVIVRLQRLTAATAILSQGPDNPRLEVPSGSDEIGQLAAAFTQMADNLGDYRREVEEKERLRRSLLERIVHVQEEERRNVSRELHDQLGQSLSALLLTVQAKCTHSETPGAECGQLEGRIHDLIGEVHRLAWQMRPPVLDDFGLDSALRIHIEEVSKYSGIGIDYEHGAPPALGRLPSWVETTLYRIAQEALTNVVRHSHATWASVVLLRQRQEILLLVEDNGNGFDSRVAHSRSNGRLGVVGMRERVLQCGGTLAIESAKETGTTVRVKIPLEEELPCQSVH